MAPSENQRPAPATARISIIGGGAGGLVAAIAAAEEARELGRLTEVRVYEATDKIGRPILASGNGRCNFSNSKIDPSLYFNSDFAAKSLDHAETLFGVSDSVRPHPNCVTSWFYEHGLDYIEEGEGRLYPRANKSSSVLDVLRFSLERLNIQIILDAKAESIDVSREDSKQLTMRMADGSFERADKIIVACGGDAGSRLLSAQIVSFAEKRPVLCPLRLDEAGRRVTRKLENIRVRCVLYLYKDGVEKARERGEAMFRKYGVSGICAFNLSRVACEGDTLRLCLMPDFEYGEMVSILEERVHMLEKVFGGPINATELLRGMLLSRVAEVAIEGAGLPLDASCDTDTLRQLARVLQGMDFVVEGPADIEHAQVRRGGFDVNGIEASTLRIKRSPRIHVIGEALNVDGPCGGYNLNWAFATGLLAGRASVHQI